MKKRTKKSISVATKVFTRVLLSVVLCAVMYVSMQFISVGIFGDEVGYRIIQQEKDGSAHYVPELEYHYKENETSSVRSDLDLPDNQIAEPIIEASDTTQTVMNVVAQILMLVVLGIFPYNILWQFGNRDDTNVRYKGQRPDPYRGIKIGFLAMIPFALFWVLLLVARFIDWNGYYQFFNLINSPFMPFNNLLLGTFESLKEVALWRFFLLLPTLLFVPIVSGIAYRMGGNQFSLVEFITFKKKVKGESEEEI